MSVGEKLFTADELFEMGSDRRVELVDGELRKMNPAGSLHGSVSSRLVIRLGGFVSTNRLGETFTAEAGFLLKTNPDTVRAPDVAFVCQDELPDCLPEGYFEGAPTLAAEVVSPIDRLSDVMAKVELWLQAGSKVVWLIDPVRKSASISKLSDGHVVSHDVDHLVDDDLLPGFELPLSELWD